MKDPRPRVCRYFCEGRLVEGTPGQSQVPQTKVLPPLSVRSPTQPVPVECFHHGVVNSFSRGLQQRSLRASVQVRPGTVLQVRGQDDVGERVLSVGHQDAHRQGVQQLEIMVSILVQDELSYSLRPQSQLDESSRVFQLGL